MAKEVTPEAAAAKTAALETISTAAQDWRAAKKAERSARQRLAGLVNEAVQAGIVSENKIAKSTEIPRMTIRKMLGKDA
jgi:DNA invertase Pin-like site-specific DNA recombinase